MLLPLSFRISYGFRAKLLDFTETPKNYNWLIFDNCVNEVFTDYIHWKD